MSTRHGHRVKECNGVAIKVTPGGRMYEVECGAWHGGTVELCDPCQQDAEKQYPQGWTGYPGDTCEHGVYVGGVGEDRMCPACEADDDDDISEEEPHDDTPAINPPWWEGR